MFVAPTRCRVEPMSAGWKKVTTIMGAARCSTPKTAGQPGWSDTVLVGAAAGLIISTPAMMALSQWLKSAVSVRERVVLLVLGLCSGAVSAAARRRFGARRAPQEVDS